MRHLQALILVASLPAYAQEQMLLGSWDGGDRYSMAVYGTLEVTRTQLSWGGRNRFNPKCSVGYSIEKEPPGVTFMSQTGEKFTTSPDSKFKTYLLKLKPAKCADGFTHLRLTFQLAPNYDYLAVVEYSGLAKTVGNTHFHRHVPSPK
jgi:hypothetical protein